MNESKIQIFASLLIAITTLGLVGCASSKQSSHFSNSAPPMAYATAMVSPVQESADQDSTFPGTRAFETPQSPDDERDTRVRNILQAKQLQWELLSQFEIRDTQVEFSDRNYIVPSHGWLQSTFLPYARHYLRANQLIGPGEGRDCDNASHALRHLLVLSNAQAHGANQGDVPCGIFKTRQNTDFGGVAGDGSWHSLILIRTGKGWVVVEPQTGHLVPFEDYPNREATSWALL